MGNTETSYLNIAKRAVSELPLGRGCEKSELCEKRSEVDPMSESPSGDGKDREESEKRNLITPVSDSIGETLRELAERLNASLPADFVLSEDDWQRLDAAEAAIGIAVDRRNVLELKQAASLYEIEFYSILDRGDQLAFGLRQAGPTAFAQLGDGITEPLWYEAAPKADNDYWWSLMTNEDRAYATAKPICTRCVWCHRLAGHTEICRQMHADWAIRLPFGKHKGKPVAAIPHDYLVWLKSNSSSLTDELRAEIERVLHTPEPTFNL